MQKEQLKLSIIVPVYNRPNEIEELLASLSLQSDKDFEIVIVEDGSVEDLSSKPVIDTYKDKLTISYFYKENTGPGQSRNYGCDRANGNYFIFLDSDCIIPSQYIETIKTNLDSHYVDCFGGPDSASDDFSNLQKSISYAMTAFLTTGGIRGGSEKVDKFYPRSFNMGFSREVYEKTNGFPICRFAKAKAAGEDMDLSISIKELGFESILLKDAYVYHKRRTNLKQFYNQVSNFGFARISIAKRHPGSLKLIHALPTAFTLFTVLMLVLGLICTPYFLLPNLLHILMLFVDSSIRSKSVVIGLLSVITSYIQLCGYGVGFLSALLKQGI